MFWHLSVKKAIIILLIMAAIGTVGIFYLANKKPTDLYNTALIRRGHLAQTVSETGTVKAAEEIDLSFSNSGKIRKLYFDVGAQVNAGDILGELDYSTLSTKKQEAQANVDVAKQSLLKLQSGATAEEIAVARANVDKAQTAYDSAKNNFEKAKEQATENINQAEKTLNDLVSSSADDVTTYEQAILSAQTNYDNTSLTYQNLVDNKKSQAMVTIDDKLAVGNTALDVIDRTITDDDGEDLISVKEPSYLVNTKDYYKSAKQNLEIAKTSLAAAEADDTNDNILQSADDALATLQEIFSSLQNCYSALENSVISSNFTQADLDTLKAGISTQQTNIAAAMSAVQTASQGLKDAILNYNTNIAAAKQNLSKAQAAYDDAVKNARNALSAAKIAGDKQVIAAQGQLDSAEETLNVYQTELSKLLAPPNQYDISLQEAKIRQAKAVLDSFNEQINDSIIKAPIKGVITKVNFEEGEQAGPGTPVFSMLGENNLEIEVLISEADITKVKKNDPVDITFDAFGEDMIFTGEVSFIEPAETIIQDVVYYKVTVEFDPRKEGVKSGMTANVVIMTDERNDVLIAPSRAIIERNGSGKFIRVLEKGKLIEKPVTIGLRGDEGMVEIMSGVDAGEEVVTYIKENK